MNERETPRFERPRVEPEIIPPDHWRSREGIFTATRIRVTRLGPLTFFMLAATTAALLLLLVVLLVGAFLVALPLAGLVVGLALALRLLYRPR